MNWLLLPWRLQRMTWGLLVIIVLGIPLTAKGSANLQFYTQPAYGVSSTGNWGQNINLSLSVANLGNSASGAFTVSIYLSPTSTYNAATAYPWLAGSNAISFGSLNALTYSFLPANTPVRLPAPIPSGLGSTTLGSTSTVYVIAIISQNGVSTYASTQITTSTPDLVGYNSQGYGFSLQQSTASWGQVVGVEFAIANFSGSAAGPFTANFYLCETNSFGSGNVPSANTHYLGSLTASAGLLPGTFLYSTTTAGAYGYNNFQLPNSNPFGDSNTNFYIGMVINPTTNNTIIPITEVNYANDCNQGSGIDYAPLTVTAPKAQIAVSGSNPAGSQNSLQFGNINIGESSTQAVTISDNGFANLTISNVTATGAFTITNVVSSIQNLTAPYFPGVIAPNNEENRVVTVTYAPTAASQQTGALTITSNDPNTPTTTFALSGTGVAVPHLAFANPIPSNNDNLIANYGGVADNGSLTETFVLSNTGSAPLVVSQNGIALTTTQSGVWSLVSVTSSTQGAINLSSTSHTIAANGTESWSVVVKFLPATNQGYSTGLQIFSNDPSTPTTTGAPTITCALQGQGLIPMTIGVASAVNGIIDSNPLVMNFGSIHATGQQQITGTITLTNSGQMPLVIAQNGIFLGNGTNFQITGITSNTQGAINLSTGSGTVAANAGETWTISVLFQPTGIGSDNTTLTISSNDPTHGTDPIALNGTGLNQPGIVVKTPQGGATLPFGPVLNDGAGNHVGTQTFTVQNIGLLPLIISQNGINLTNATGFSIRSVTSSTQGTINLASGTATIAAKQAETWIVTVGLDPTGNSAYSGTLNIASNDPVTPSVSLALSGTGTKPTLVLKPTTSGTPTLYIEAGQVYNINWTGTDTSDTSSSATLTLSTSASNTLPASGLTTLVTIPYSATTSSYAWRPSASLIGQAVYIYGNLQDQGVSVGSYSAQKVYVEAAGSFNLLSPLTTTSGSYIYQYLYNGKAYAGTATLQSGSNVLNITTSLSGGGTVVHQVIVNQVSTLLAAQGYTYDEMKRVKTYTNGNGITTTYTYSLAGNLIQTSASNGNVINYNYDSLNRKTSMVDSTGTTFYGYDDLDRVTSIAYSLSGVLTDPNNLVLVYTYDTANRLTDLNYPGGEHIQYGWDNAGRMLTANDLTSGQSTTYNYLPTTGQLHTVTRANGVVTTYGYDTAGRLNDIKHANSGGHTLAEYSYTAIDPNGNATALLTTFNDGSQKQELYTYDSLQRLIQVTYGASSVAVPNTDKTVVYTYDNNGNRLTQATTINGAVTQTLTYTYGSENRLVQIVDQNNILQDSYVYDAAGNRIEKITPGGNTYYSYDERNLLTTVITPSDYFLYTYDGNGQRASQTVDGALTSYVTDPSQKIFQVVQERNGIANLASALFFNHVYGMDRLQSESVSGITSFYLPDRLDSVRLSTDQSGNIVSSYNFDAFGVQK